LPHPWQDRIRYALFNVATIIIIVKRAAESASQQRVAFR
jgi:hypothetical protein